MKNKLLILTGIIGLSFQIGFGQIEKKITGIRRQVMTINKELRTYKKTKKSVAGVSTEGAEAAYYTSGKDLKKISANIYGETYRSTVELYYRGGELIFTFYRYNHYDTQIFQKKPVKIVKVEEERSYFDGGKLIRLLNGKSSIKPGDEKWGEAEKDMIELSEEFKKQQFEN